jgi:hypothetical protein
VHILGLGTKLVGGLVQAFGCHEGNGMQSAFQPVPSSERDTQLA